MRQIVLDTETTGLETSLDHRIIEIGCVEMQNRRITGNYWHHYLQPDREIDQGAFEVHGIGQEQLADKPRFADLADEFIEFVRGAELVIHNADFDIGFLNHELQRMGHAETDLRAICPVEDTLKRARQMYPGQRNNLDALCRRLSIDNSARTLHGALLDSEILADVYLRMTGGQSELGLGAGADAQQRISTRKSTQAFDAGQALRWQASDEDQQAHQAYLELLEKKSGQCLW